MNRVSKGWDWLSRGKNWLTAQLKRVREQFSNTKAWLLAWPGQEHWHVPGWLWLLGLLPWALFTALLWLRLAFLLPDDETAFLYLLSALSQGMAAVLALTFTISLVAAQLSARYSYRLVERLLTPFTIGYILLFSVAVVLPLALLPSPTAGEVRLSLSLGALALALLVPYFRYFLYRITPRSLLEDLSWEAEKKLRVGQEAAQIEEIEIIEDIAASAVPLNDYRTYYLAQEKLGELALIRQSRVK